MTTTGKGPYVLTGHAHYIVEFTERREYEQSPGKFYNANRSMQVIARSLPRALQVFTERHPEATCHVIRKIGLYDSIVIDTDDARGSS